MSFLNTRSVKATNENKKHMNNEPLYKKVMYSVLKQKIESGQAALVGQGHGGTVDSQCERPYIGNHLSLFMIGK